MNKTFSNPCSRCGTERILIKEYTEKVGTSEIITKETICPNPDCQKLVDQDNKRASDKTTAMRLKSEQRAVQRRAERDAQRVAKNQ